MRLIHLTDPHLSSLEGLSFFRLRGKRRSGYLSWLKKRRFVHRREVLDRLTAAVRAENPDLILVTGDLVHIGLEREIQQAAEWMASLGPPERVVLIPGNHDNYAGDSLASMRRLWAAWLPDGPADPPDFAAEYPVVRDIRGIRLIGLNTACVTPVFSAAGELGPAQLARLSEQLEQPPNESYLCLLIHHPPFPGMTVARKALRDARPLQDLLERQPPDLTLYGHIHRNREHELPSSRIYCTDSASVPGRASFRVFDIERTAEGWETRMRLMCHRDGNGADEGFRSTGESVWSRSC